ncbi:MAG TPA: amidohydrolase family protein [Thermoanaerobaculia bacterium]|nr:amidohydrolase family protein [Thermoanaerobaculia bacterium]
MVLGLPVPAAGEAGVLALVGGTLVDGTGAAPLPDAVVVARDGRIACAGSRTACPVPEGARVLDVSGHWLTPGLVDAHVHYSQTGWADGRPDALDVRERHPYPRVVAGLAAHPERFDRSYLCSGVTAVFDVGGYPWTLGLGDAARDDPWAPRVAAAGPLLSTWDFWLNLPAERQFLYLAEPADATPFVRYLAARGADAVKVWFIPVEERPFAELEAVVTAAGAAAREAGLPLVVHATGLREAKAALRAGARVLVHSVDDAPVDAELLELARANGTVYTPTLTVSRGYLRLYRSALAGEAPEIDDPRGCVDPETRARVAETAGLGDLARAEGLDAGRLEAFEARIARREEMTAANLLAVHRAGIPVAMGTDAGNPLTLPGVSVHAELEAMAAAGLSPAEVLVAATRGGARAMGLEDEIGTLEPGKAADLLVLAADPTASVRAFRELRWVVRAGLPRPVEELSSGPARAAEAPAPPP